MSASDPYWTDDQLAGEMMLRDGPSSVRLRIHRSEESYPKHHRELTVIDPAPGTRDYVHVHPYILLPRITLTVGVYSQADDTGAVGEVIDSQWEGMQHQQIGNGQAWFYRRDHLLMVWEVDIFSHFVTAPHPTEDTVLPVVWRAFETYLLGQFPETRRIVTPSWEPEHPDDWQPFLVMQGYHQHASEPAIFEKAPDQPSVSTPATTENPR
jgi:hypothetical protein